MALDDEVLVDEEYIGKRVYVEAQLYGGAISRGGSNNCSQLYWGDYMGVKTLRGHDVVVLSDAGYINNAGINVANHKKPENIHRVTSKSMMIPWQHVLSISLYKKPDNEEKGE